MADPPRRDTSLPVDEPANTVNHPQNGVPSVVYFAGDTAARTALSGATRFNPLPFGEATPRPGIDAVLVTSGDESILAEHRDLLRSQHSPCVVAISDDRFTDPHIDRAVFAYLPTQTGLPLLEHALENAFRHITSTAAHQTFDQRVTEITREIDELNSIGVALSAEQDTSKLLETILTKSRQITGADAGSIYVVENADDGGAARRLRFALAQNDSVAFDFRQSTMEVSARSIAGYVVLSGQSINIPDAYHLPPGVPYAINRKFDEESGYRTKSDVVFTHEQMKELRYASLLHDFGKVAVREELLVKARKLYPHQLETIRQRFQIAKRTLESEVRSRELQYAVEFGMEAYLERAPEFAAQLAQQWAELDDCWRTVEAANVPSLMPEGAFEHLREIAAREFTDIDGQRYPLLNDDEVRLLSIRKGTLDEAERRKVEEHVAHTFQFLNEIPWTREFRNIPQIAQAHHEKLNGVGYPNKLTAGQIPIQSRMMAIADIFDGLAAVDRPYKKAQTTEKSLEIMRGLAANGELDGDLLDLFIGEQVYKFWRIDSSTLPGVS